MPPLHLIAGIDFNTGIRGILVVTLAIVILPGSVYLLLATNMGSRLGLLVALAAVFGWISILTMTWWITSPANGPRGRNASWKPVEVYVEGSGPARTEVLNKLPASTYFPNAEDIINANPQILKNYPNPSQATLSDIAGNDPEVLAKAMEGKNLNGWRIVPQSSAGDAATVADNLLTTGAGALFKETTDYKHLATFDYGGKPTRAEYCGSKDSHPHNLINGDSLCRLQYKFSKLIQFRSPTHYEVVQVQQVIPQETVPGHAPPLPQVDPTQPVISIVLVRDLGQARLLPAVMFMVAFSLFIVFVLLLHYRDKTLRRNLAEAAALEAEGKV